MTMVSEDLEFLTIGLMLSSWPFPGSSRGMTSPERLREMSLVPTPGISQATGMADAAHAAHAHDRQRDAENKAELEAMRGSRFPVLRRLLNRLSRRNR